VFRGNITYSGPKCFSVKIMIHGEYAVSEFSLMKANRVHCVTLRFPVLCDSQYRICFMSIIHDLDSF
jgi:hypothetical protein